MDFLDRGYGSTSYMPGSCTQQVSLPTAAVSPPTSMAALPSGKLEGKVRVSLNPSLAISEALNWQLESLGVSGYIKNLVSGQKLGDEDDFLRFGRRYDPDNPQRTAFYYMIHPDDAKDDYGSIRTEASNWNGNAIPTNVAVWIGFALRLPDLSCIPSGSIDSQVVSQLHFAANGTEHHPPLAMYFEPGNKLKLRISKNSGPIVNSDGSSDSYYPMDGGAATPVGTWQYYVIKAKFTHLTGGYFKMWRSVGTGAPVEMLGGGLTGPNTYNTLRLFPKEGLYHWSTGQTFTAGNASYRARFGKGVHVFTDDGDMNAIDVFKLLFKI